MAPIISYNITPEHFQNLIKESIREELKLFETPSRDSKEALLSRSEVAKLFRVSLTTINTWCKDGILNPIKMNSRVYFKQSEIEEAMQKPVKYLRRK